jgi:ribulose-phosphate 3-epimerase
MIIAPSILSADFLNLQRDIDESYNEGIRFFHLDVMDGNFVPNISFGQPVIKSLCKNRKEGMILDAHLMVDSPVRYVEEFCDMGCDFVTIHPEREIHVERVLSLIRSKNCKAGIALNPATPLTILEYLIHTIDLILIMTVNPGFGGQSFISGMENKIKNTAEMIKLSGKDILLQVDGGIKPQNIGEIKKLGVDVAVCGSSVYNEKGIKTSLIELRSNL